MTGTSAGRAGLAIAVCSAAIVLSGRIAAQDEAPRSFSLKSPSTQTCPAVASFPWRVQARTRRAVVAAPGAADVDFTLVVDVADRGASGRLEVVTQGDSSKREVRGASCDEVVEALALVAALILDPRASTAPTATLPPAPTEEPNASEPPRAAPASPAAAPTRDAPTQTPARAAPRADKPRERWRFTGGVRAFVSGGIAPDPVLAPGGFVGALYDTDDRLIEPLLRLGIAASRSEIYETKSETGIHLGDAQFEWWALELSGCPLRWPTAGSFALRPCAAVEAGSLTGQGSNTRDPAEQSALWLALGAAARLEWAALDVLRLELEGGAGFPLARDSFFFEPQRTVHQVPAVFGRAALGLAVVLP